MTEQNKPSSLRELDVKLRQARKSAEEKAGGSQLKGASRRGLGLAMRLGVEIVASLIIGVLIGLLLDQWLGTTPWLMLVFFVLGSAAGFMNVYRVATGIGQGVGYRPSGAVNEDSDNDDANNGTNSDKDSNRHKNENAKRHDAPEDQPEQ
jgi:ATP synthase protein I